MLVSSITTFRLIAKSSQTMEIISITAANEINKPVEERAFHGVYASGSQSNTVVTWKGPESAVERKLH